MKTFAIIFDKNKKRLVIPSSWISNDKKSYVIPPDLSSSQLKEAIIKVDKPEKSWKSLALEKIVKYEDKYPNAIQFSLIDDIENATDPSDEDKLKKSRSVRKKKYLPANEVSSPKSKKNRINSSSDQDEDLEKDKNKDDEHKSKSSKTPTRTSPRTRSSPKERSHIPIQDDEEQVVLYEKNTEQSIVQQTPESLNVCSPIKNIQYEGLDEIGYNEPEFESDADDPLKNNDKSENMTDRKLLKNIFDTQLVLLKKMNYLQRKLKSLENAKSSHPKETKTFLMSNDNINL